MLTLRCRRPNNGERRSVERTGPGGLGRAGSGLSPWFEDTSAGLICARPAVELATGPLATSLPAAAQASAEPSTCAAGRGFDGCGARDRERRGPALRPLRRPCQRV